MGDRAGPVGLSLLQKIQKELRAEANEIMRLEENEENNISFVRIHATLTIMPEKGAGDDKSCTAYVNRRQVAPQSRQDGVMYSIHEATTEKFHVVIFFSFFNSFGVLAKKNEIIKM